MLHKRKNIVLLLGKMLCYVVNLTPLSSHLLIQKTFPHAVKFDIFKESRTVSAFARNSLFHVPFSERQKGRSGLERPSSRRAPRSAAQPALVLPCLRLRGAIVRQKRVSRRRGRGETELMLLLLSESELALSKASCCFHPTESINKHNVIKKKISAALPNSFRWWCLLFILLVISHRAVSHWISTGKCFLSVYLISWGIFI